ncbi:transcription factor GTE3, chloroplastic-like [Cucurbita pepo subsp. pepo]|uniref:transcription factor GTE3, chloroplastic-like n=1 Tax=Cucurbita pepo subsp. pepo TaxID=3664 RepID=UPI000C9D9C07|nr:transcription factor GTE3, chloroplastic-like [Cucurbita pepo subsp. pepo]XP_023538314.1 transcription factor GTE3, chloroplastic-like [Cucurbita pepo subsp. pepo]XP_023538323.1 transcription factor GTE3, chloroplastic-like [Cucurbita pepo subsp. pepo]
MASVLRGGGEPGGNPRRTDDNKFSTGKQRKESKIPKRARNSVQIPAVAAANGGGDPSSPSHYPIDALVTSRDSSGQNRYIEQVNADGVPGYTRFENRVRICLNSRSRSGIKELTTKLKGELDHVRNLVKKFESQELQISGYGGDVGHSQSQFSANNLVEKVGNTWKDDSVVGSADVPASRLVRSVSVAENFGEFAEKEMNKHKNSRYNPKTEFPVSDCDSNRGKIDPLLKSCNNLLERLMKHKHGWVFNVPVDAKRLGLHDYHKIITKPMDLGTVKMRLNKNWYKSPREFAEDVRLTFSNAITYNPKGEDVHIMAEQLSNVFEEKWRIIEAKQNVGKDDGSRKSPALATPPVESRTFSKSESTTKPPPANRESLGKSDSITTPANVPDKKPNAKNHGNIEMNYEEKQKLSIDLQDLPSDELNNVVKIIKKRNQGLFQNDDEIELDIGSVDSKTLWELERFVADYKKSLITNKRKVDADLQSSRFSTKDMDRAVDDAGGGPVGGNADSEGEGDSSSTCGDANQSPSG